MLYEASLPCNQSCKGTWVYYRVKNCIFIQLKTIEKLQWSFIWFIKQKSTNGLISKFSLRFSHLKLNIILRKKKANFRDFWSNACIKQK